MLTLLPQPLLFIITEDLILREVKELALTCKRVSTLLNSWKERWIPWLSLINADPWHLGFQLMVKIIQAQTKEQGPSYHSFSTLYRSSDARTNVWLGIHYRGVSPTDEVTMILASDLKPFLDEDLLAQASPLDTHPDKYMVLNITSEYLDRIFLELFEKLSLVQRSFGWEIVYLLKTWKEYMHYIVTRVSPEMLVSLARETVVGPEWCQGIPEWSRLAIRCHRDRWPSGHIFTSLQQESV